MRYSLLHPSRGRIVQAENAIEEWLVAASGHHDIEYILSVDDDDDVAGYRTMAERRGVGLIVGRNRSIVDAVNRAAAKATGDMFIVVSDDFGCPAGWDEVLAEILGDQRDVAVLVHDGMDARILTLPIVGRELYERLGYVYHPDYISMFCDDDLTETARGDGKLIDARHVVFPHRHFTVGGLHFDATYARERSRLAWLQGFRVFRKRTAVDFGRKPRTIAVRLIEARVEAKFWCQMALHKGKRLAMRLTGRVSDRLPTNETHTSTVDD
jgi:hypothetical protein